LYSALRRLEKGENLYTHVENDELLHYGWMIENQKKGIASEIHQAFEFKKEGVVLYDFYTHPKARGQGLYQKSLTQMIADAKSLNETKPIYISALKSNGPSCHVIEKMGFRYLKTLSYSRLLWLRLDKRDKDHTIYLDKN